MPETNDYILNTYNALRDKVQGFNRSPEEFRSLMLSDSNYRTNVYNALKDKIQGFQRTPQEFDSLVGVQTKINPIDKAVQKDRSEIGKTFASMWNNFVSGAESLFSGVMERIPEGAMPLTVPGAFSPTSFIPSLDGKEITSDETLMKYALKQGVKEFQKGAKEKAVPAVEKAFKVLKTDYVTPEEQQRISEINFYDKGFLENLQAFAASAGRLTFDIPVGMVTGGSSYYFQSYGEAKKDYREQVKKTGMEYNPLAEEVYANTVGLVSSALEKYGIDKIFGAGPAFKNIQKRVVADVFKKVGQANVKISTPIIEKAVQTGVRNLTNNIKSKGAKVAYGTIVEGGTETLQAGLQEAAKIITNKIQGGEVYDEQKIKDDLVKNLVNAGGAGAVFGAPLGMISLIGKNVNTSLLKEVSRAKTDEDFNKIQNDLEDVFNKYNYTEQDRENTMSALRKYSDIKRKIPKDLPADAQEKVITKIDERDNVQATVNQKKEELANLDTALQGPVQKDIDTLSEKVNSLNDEISEIAYGIKYRYFEGDEINQPGKYFRQQEGQSPEEISKDRYDIESIRQQDAGLEEINLIPMLEEALPFVTDEQARTDISNVIQKMNNAEYVNENDLNKAADHLYNTLDKFSDNKSFAGIIEPLIDKIENYDFATETKTTTVTETVPTIVAREATERERVGSEISQFAGNKATITDETGNEVTGNIVFSNGLYTLTDDNNNTIYTIGEKAITDRGVKLSEESPIVFDEDGNVKAVNLTLSKARDGQLVPVSNMQVAFASNDEGLDFAIRLRMDEVGDIPQPLFDLVYEQVSKEVSEEVPKFPERLGIEKPVIKPAAAPVVEQAKAAPAPRPVAQPIILEAPKIEVAEQKATEEPAAPLKQVVGSTDTVKFADGVEGIGDVTEKFTYKLIESDELIPSHLPSGERNPAHTIALAQPKERNDKMSRMAQEKIAKSPSIKEAGEGPTAYVGAPIVNTRGEVIQGNNRSIGLKKHYSRGGEEYKAQLKEQAERFGINPADVDKMKNPILVREVDVDDARAVELGLYDIKDTETGGRGRLDPVVVVRKMTDEDKGKLSALVFDSEETTIKGAIRANPDAIGAIVSKYLNPAQRNTIFNKDGSINATGIDDIEKVVNNLIFESGPAVLPEAFSELPDMIQKNVQKAIKFLFGVPKDSSILPELQRVILGLYDFDKSGVTSIDTWLRQTNMITQKAPRELFSPFEIELMKVLNGAKKQSELSNRVQKFADLVNGRPADMFEAAIPGISKEEAINKIFVKDEDITKGYVAPKSELGATETRKRAKKRATKTESETFEQFSERELARPDFDAEYNANKQEFFGRVESKEAYLQRKFCK
jgi:hypothetical protein